MIKDIEGLVKSFTENEDVVVDINTDYRKSSGIYLLYVDCFEDDWIAPIYVGKAKDIQNRYKQHFKDVMSLNRLSKEFYKTYLSKRFYNGKYKACKIFHYMVEHDCTLKDLKMVVLELCDEPSLDSLEQHYIKLFRSEYFGFNQLETMSRFQDESFKALPHEEKNRMRMVELENLKSFRKYGYNEFNAKMVYGLRNIGELDDSVEYVNSRHLAPGAYDELTDKEKKQRVDSLREKFQYEEEFIVSELLPDKEYSDFPLKYYRPKLKMPVLRKNQCNIYVVITNDGRQRRDTSYIANPVKVIVEYQGDAGLASTSYYITCNECNKTYYEKDYNRMIVHRSPFQVRTSLEEETMISFPTELVTGVNDYELRGKKLWGFEEAIEAIIDRMDNGVKFKVVSNQSKKVLNECVKRLRPEVVGRISS